MATTSLKQKLRKKAIKNFKRFKPHAVLNEFSTLATGFNMGFNACWNALQKRFKEDKQEELKSGYCPNCYRVEELEGSEESEEE